MRIISKFHDYYDRGMGQGQDQSLLYVRHTQEIKGDDRAAYPILQKFSHPMGIIKEDIYNRLETVPFFVGFCGKMYRGIAVRRQYWSLMQTWVTDDTAMLYYDLTLLEQCFAQYGFDLHKSEQRRWYKGWMNERKKRLTEWLGNQGTLENEKMMIEKRISIFTVSEIRHGNGTLIINPRLTDFGFYKLFNAYQAFQELSMWIGGVLPRDGALMATVDEKHRYMQHGFDPKWSFRKMPQK